MMTRRLVWKWSLLVMLSLVMTGCYEWGYYRQAAAGQWQLLARRQDVGAVIADPRTSTEVRARLELAQQIRDFAVTELHLPDNKSYRTYADLERPYAVWNVVATPAYSLEPVTWCFPVAGCVPYRGYFTREDAEAFAARLREQGQDVRVYGVAAYSTLNWFDDPLLNTFIHYREPNLAGLIFHELAHQLIYVKHDGTFNESFAQAVEEIGTSRWLEERGQSAQLEAHQQRQLQHRQFVDLLHETRRRLADFYADTEDRTKAQRQQGKEVLIEDFRQRYRQWQQEQWPESSRYDAWVSGPLNNAHFALVATYHDYVPAFFHILNQQDQNLPRFYDAVRKLAELHPDERRQQLQQLLPADD